MSRLSYKTLYINERMISDTYKNTLNEILKFLPEIGINVIDKEIESHNHFGYDRLIEITKKKKDISIIISHILEEENQRYLESKRG